MMEGVLSWQFDEYRAGRVAGRLPRWVSDGAASAPLSRRHRARKHPRAVGPGVVVVVASVGYQTSGEAIDRDRDHDLRPARRRPAAAGASVWVAGAVVYAVTWWESVPLPVLTFGVVAAIAALISHFEQTTEKDEK
jgi:hypothetical protein